MLAYPMVAIVIAGSGSLARAIQDFTKDGAQHDAMVSLSGVQRT